MFTLKDLNPDEAAALQSAFEQSYTKATGASWDARTFFGRARNWTFFGSKAPVGVVAVRIQRSGFWKLVGVAGSPRGILAGTQELKAANAPVWGAVSAEMVPMCTRMGLIAPHMTPGTGFMLRNLLPLIPAEVFGGHLPELLPGGGIRVHVTGIGPVEKYIVVSPEYLKRVMPQALVMFPALLASLPGQVLSGVLGARRNPILTRGGLKRAVVYHGSHSAPAQMEDYIAREFQQKGSGRTYGTGIYCTLEENPKLPTFDGRYGSYVYKLAVNTERFLAFSSEFSQKLFGEVLSLGDQADRIGLVIPKQFREVVPPPGDEVDPDDSRSGRVSAIQARAFSSAIQGMNRKIPDGLLFQGGQDGPVAVVYNSHAVMLLGWKKVGETEWQPLRASRTGLLRSPPVVSERLRFQTDVAQTETPVSEEDAARFLLTGVSPSRSRRSSFFTVPIQTEQGQAEVRVVLVGYRVAFGQDGRGRWSGEPYWAVAIPGADGWLISDRIATPVWEKVGASLGVDDVFADGLYRDGETVAWRTRYGREDQLASFLGRMRLANVFGRLYVNESGVVWVADAMPVAATFWTGRVDILWFGAPFGQPRKPGQSTDVLEFSARMQRLLSLSALPQLHPSSRSPQMISERDLIAAAKSQRRLQALGEEFERGLPNPGRPYLSLSVTEAAARAAASRGVSAVARGPGGFLSAYRKAGGSAARLTQMQHTSGQTWSSRRDGFVARHMAQADHLWERDPKGGERPTRRHLALAVWAYSPDPARLKQWLNKA